MGALNSDDLLLVNPKSHEANESMRSECCTASAIFISDAWEQTNTDSGE